MREKIPSQLRKTDPRQLQMKNRVSSRKAGIRKIMDGKLCHLSRN